MDTAVPAQLALVQCNEPAPHPAPACSKWSPTPFFLFLTALAVRVVFLVIAPNNSTDAWARYLAALRWLQHPADLPPASVSDAWLPMHFWLLGSVLWITKSEMGARVFSVLLSSLTVVLLAGIVARTLDRRLAPWTALFMAFFGFHIAFSVTTGSEALTIFLVVLGVYAWLGYASERTWTWFALSVSAFIAATLCRFEPWLCAPVLAFMLLDFSDGCTSAWLNRCAWRQAFGFGLCASAGAIGWLIFSQLKWGDALRLPHRTMWLNLHFQTAHHSVLFRLLTVPASLMLSLSPVVVALAALGMVCVVRGGSQAARCLALLALVLFAFNYYNSVKYEVTQARYTVLYSWLFLPFVFEGLRWMSSRWSWAAGRRSFAGTLLFFLLWQGGIIAGARYAPPPFADRLGALAPTLPLHREMQQLTSWLKANPPQQDALILDDYNWESSDIWRFAPLPASATFSIRQADYDDPAELKQRLEGFVKRRRPALLVCSPAGPIGSMWQVDRQNVLHVQDLSLHFSQLWQGEHWRIYRVTYD